MARRRAWRISRKTSGRIGALQSGTTRTLTAVCNGRPADGPAIAGASLWLRSEWNHDGVSRFSWSVDGRDFKRLGDDYQLTWGSYRGDRIGLYSFNEVNPRGYLDVDSFTYV